MSNQSETSYLPMLIRTCTELSGGTAMRLSYIILIISCIVGYFKFHDRDTLLIGLGVLAMAGVGEWVAKLVDKGGNYW